MELAPWPWPCFPGSAFLPGADSSAAAPEGSVSVLRWPPSLLLPGAPLSLEHNQNNKTAPIPWP